MKLPPRPGGDAAGLRAVVLKAEFNAHVVDGLVSGAREALGAMGLGEDRLEIVAVPGAFELPLAARAAVESRRFDAVIALGAVIRGDTDHYEHVARAVTDGLALVGLAAGVPVAFGVLTCRSEAQALARAAAGPDNKGAEAARAAVAMTHALRALRVSAEASGGGDLPGRRRGPRAKQTSRRSR